MRRYLTDLEKLLIVLCGFTLAFFLEVHILIWYLSASYPDQSALLRLLGIGFAPVALVTVVIGAVVKFYFVD
jgi:tellurite resistance protein TehA-like permease